MKTVEHIGSMCHKLEYWLMPVKVIDHPGDIYWDTRAGKLLFLCPPTEGTMLKPWSEQIHTPQSAHSQLATCPRLLAMYQLSVRAVIAQLRARYDGRLLSNCIHRQSMENGQHKAWICLFVHNNVCFSNTNV